MKRVTLSAAHLRKIWSELEQRPRFERRCSVCAGDSTVLVFRRFDTKQFVSLCSGCAPPVGKE